MIIELSFLLPSPTNDLAPNVPNVVGIILIAIYAAISLTLIIAVVSATAGYIAGRSSVVSRAALKGAGVGIVVGVCTSILCMSITVFAAGVYPSLTSANVIFTIVFVFVAVGPAATWFVVRKIFPRHSGD